MSPQLKHIPVDEAFFPSDFIHIEKGKINSRILFNSPQTRIVLFAFDKGCALGAHSINGDVLLQVLEGSAEICINSQRQVIHHGEFITIPAHAEHSIKASDSFKMLLCALMETS